MGERLRGDWIAARSIRLITIATSFITGSSLLPPEVLARGSGNMVIHAQLAAPRITLEIAKQAAIDLQAEYQSKGKGPAWYANDRDMPKVKIILDFLKIGKGTPEARITELQNRLITAGLLKDSDLRFEDAPTERQKDRKGRYTGPTADATVTLIQNESTKSATGAVGIPAGSSPVAGAPEVTPKRQGKILREGWEDEKPLRPVAPSARFVLGGLGWNDVTEGFLAVLGTIEKVRKEMNATGLNTENLEKLLKEVEDAIKNTPREKLQMKTELLRRFIAEYDEIITKTSLFDETAVRAALPKLAKLLEDIKVAIAQLAGFKGDQQPSGPRIAHEEGNQRTVHVKDLRAGERYVGGSRIEIKLRFTAGSELIDSTKEAFNYPETYVEITVYRKITVDPAIDKIDVYIVLPPKAPTKLLADKDVINVAWLKDDGYVYMYLDDKGKIWDVENVRDMDAKEKRDKKINEVKIMPYEKGHEKDRNYHLHRAEGDPRYIPYWRYLFSNLSTARQILPYATVVGTEQRNSVDWTFPLQGALRIGSNEEILIDCPPFLSEQVRVRPSPER